MIDLEKSFRDPNDILEFAQYFEGGLDAVDRFGRPYEKQSLALLLRMLFPRANVNQLDALYEMHISFLSGDRKKNRELYHLVIESCATDAFSDAQKKIFDLYLLIP